MSDNGDRTQYEIALENESFNKYLLSRQEIDLTFDVPGLLRQLRAKWAYIELNADRLHGLVTAELANRIYSWQVLNGTSANRDAYTASLADALTLPVIDWKRLQAVYCQLIGFEITLSQFERTTSNTLDEQVRFLMQTSTEPAQRLTHALQRLDSSKDWQDQETAVEASCLAAVLCRHCLHWLIPSVFQDGLCEPKDPSRFASFTESAILDCARPLVTGSEKAQVVQNCLQALQRLATDDRATVMDLLPTLVRLCVMLSGVKSLQSCIALNAMVGISKDDLPYAEFAPLLEKIVERAGNIPAATSRALLDKARRRGYGSDEYNLLSCRRVASFGHTNLATCLLQRLWLGEDTGDYDLQYARRHLDAVARFDGSLPTLSLFELQYRIVEAATASDVSLTTLRGLRKDLEANRDCSDAELERITTALNQEMKLVSGTSAVEYLKRIGPERSEKTIKLFWLHEEIPSLVEAAEVCFRAAYPKRSLVRV